MKLWRDSSEEVGRRRPLDDTTAEELIAGRTTAGTDDLARVSTFLDELRALREGPPPPPNRALSGMLAGDPEPRAGASPWLVGGDWGAPGIPPGASHGLRRRAGDRLDATGATRPSAGVVAKAALLALVATAGVTGAAAAHLLPKPASDAVTKVVEAVTPFQLGATDEERRGQDPMSRQGEPLDTGDGDGPLASAPAGRRDAGPADQPAAAGGAGDRATPAPAVSADRSDEPRPRPGPAAGGATSTVPPAPENSPADRPTDRATAPPPGSGTFTTTLSGAADPARPGDADGVGRASVTVHSGRGVLCVAVTTSGIAPVTSVHLHQAAAPSAEAIVTGGAPADEGAPECFSVDGEVLRRIRTDPAGHYVEVHNAEFPDGALRGSLSARGA